MHPLLSQVSGQFLAPGKDPPSTHWLGGCVETRDGLVAVERRKFFCPYREFNYDFSVGQSVA
jgi:hypothetical protein